MKKHIITLFCCGLVLSATSGCAVAVIGAAAAGSGYYVGHDNRTVGVMASDASITTTINASYVADDLVKNRKIEIDTYDGTVTLTGSVESEAARARAISLAYKAKGVRNVISKLVVNGDR